MITSDEQDEHLERLAGELGKRQFSARLVSRRSAHYLVVANPDYPDLNERTRQQIESFFGGLDLVEPSLVEVGAWRSLRPCPPAPLRFLDGVASINPDCERP